MAGETQLLELRRQYRCAAYNCAIAAISCSFSEPKFYQGFLFSEKPEKVLTYLYYFTQFILSVIHGKRCSVGDRGLHCLWVFSLVQNQFILENIIDVERTYNFPIEIEVYIFIFLHQAVVRWLPTRYFELQLCFICTYIHIHTSHMFMHQFRSHLREKRNMS